VASVLPIASSGGDLARYLRAIQKIPLLDPAEEAELARRWRYRQDIDAAHRLVTSHLRLVAKIATRFRGYGLPFCDLVSEGNTGMMRAVKRFDPDRGVRLATYAMWWIRAAMQEYVMRNSSVVQMGTTTAQKRLFFNLRRLKGQVQAFDGCDLNPEQVTNIAATLDVPDREVVDMNGRLEGPDYSLNAPINLDSETEWQNQLVDSSETQEHTLAEREELHGRRILLVNAWKTLDDRQRRILTDRFLKDSPTTLDVLSRQFGISRERVRQIENAAVRKLRRVMTAPGANCKKTTAPAGPHPQRLEERDTRPRSRQPMAVHC
jgi:RNA polymerase sigma-32 factor